MSHTANLRNRYRPSQPETSNKRRRTEDSTPKVNGLTHQANGVLPDTRLTAQPTKQAKPSKIAPPAESSAKISQPDADEDVEMAESGSELEDASSDEESNEDDDEDDADMEDGGADLASEADDEDDSRDLSDEENDNMPTTKHTSHTPASPTTAGAPDTTTAPPTSDDEPTFADLLKARGASPINIAVSEPTTASQPADTQHPSTSSRTLTAPTATSLGTVLTQALRTNDTALLESCLQVPNLESIRATIERLHSSHATTLLQRLAERLHKRPGRAGSLMVWVQWTVVAHGGYLARQPSAMRELQTLHGVVKQRAGGLQPLLALKGKLDMLEAQMQLRRNVQARTRARYPGVGEGVTYVEGEDEGSSSEENGVGGTGGGRERMTKVVGRSGIVSTDPRPKKGKGKERRKGQSAKSTRETGLRGIESDDEGSDGEMLSTMPEPADIDGFGDFGEHDDDEEDDSEDGDVDDLIDDEAEETDQDSDAALSENIDYDDVDSASASDDEEGEEDAEEEQRPKKRSKS